MLKNKVKVLFYLDYDKLNKKSKSFVHILLVFINFVTNSHGFPREK